MCLKKMNHSILSCFKNRYFNWYNDVAVGVSHAGDVITLFEDRHCPITINIDNENYFLPPSSLMLLP
jgi:hypothetical protein